MLDLIKDWILQYGYAALFGLLAVGIIGLPVPDEILMTFVGYLISIGWFSYAAAVAVCFMGSMTGMMVSFFLGKKVGKPLLFKYGKWIKLTPNRVGKAEDWFQRYGLWTVSFGYFVPGIRHFTCYLAGVSGVKLWRYLLFAGSGAILWVVTFITLGKVIGNRSDVMMPLVHKYMAIGIGGAAILAAAAAFLIIRSRKKNAKPTN